MYTHMTRKELAIYYCMLLTWDMSSNHRCSTCFHQGCVCLECHSQSVFGWNCWPDGCFYRWKKNTNHVSIVFKIFRAEILLMVTIHSIQYLFWKKVGCKNKLKLTCGSLPEKSFDYRIVCSNPEKIWKWANYVTTGDKKLNYDTISTIKITL